MRDIPEQYAQILGKYRGQLINALQDQARAEEAINDIVSLMGLEEGEQVNLDEMVIYEEGEEVQRDE